MDTSGHFGRMLGLWIQQRHEPQNLEEAEVSDEGFASKMHSVRCQSVQLEENYSLTLRRQFQSQIEYEEQPRGQTSPSVERRGRNENKSIDSSERINLENECEKVSLAEGLYMDGNSGC